MAELRGSRRAFVGTAVAGAALLGPLAFLTRGQRSVKPDEGIKFANGKMPTAQYHADPQELERWQRAVGQPFRISGAQGVAGAAQAGMASGAVIGTLGLVVVETIAGARPAGLRQHPFSLFFTFDHRDVPSGDGLYDIDHTVEGLTRLFMQRGTDRFGKAIMVALFN